MLDHVGSELAHCNSQLDKGLKGTMLGERDYECSSLHPACGKQMTTRNEMDNNI